MDTYIHTLSQLLTDEEKETTDPTECVKIAVERFKNCADSKYLYVIMYYMYFCTAFQCVYV